VIGWLGDNIILTLIIYRQYFDLSSEIEKFFKTFLKIVALCGGADYYQLRRRLGFITIVAFYL
jgi:hypothetical protein